MPDEGGAGPAVGRGAEASLRRVEWMGRAALLKDRDQKAYRPKELDERLRRERTRTEARLLLEARRLGVRTPMVYDVDVVRHRMVLEELPGPTLKQLIEASPDSADALREPIERFGLALGRLHAGGISHGDLTSSNLLYPDGPSGAPAFIDLSMGARSASLEELGIDLHLVEEDLRSLHPLAEALLKAFFQGYVTGNPDHQKEVRARAREIRGRVRYA